MKVTENYAKALQSTLLNLIAPWSISVRGKVENGKAVFVNHYDPKDKEGLSKGEYYTIELTGLPRKIELPNGMTSMTTPIDTNTRVDNIWNSRGDKLLFKNISELLERKEYTLSEEITENSEDGDDIIANINMSEWVLEGAWASMSLPFEFELKDKNGKTIKSRRRVRTGNTVTVEVTNATSNTTGFFATIGEIQDLPTLMNLADSKVKQVLEDLVPSTYELSEDEEKAKIENQTETSNIPKEKDDDDDDDDAVKKESKES